MDKKHIGISSWTFPWAIGVDGFPPPAAWDVMTLLEKARTLGVGVLQIADNMPLDAYAAGELDVLAGAARGYDISLEPGTRGLAPDRLIHYLHIAQRLDAKLVRTLAHDGADRPSLAEAAERLVHILPEYERCGIALAIENHDYYPAGWFAALMDEVNSPTLGICLDTVNNIGQGESEREVFTVLAPHAINFHCKDYVILRKSSMLGFDVEGAPPGQGMLDLRRAKDMLNPGISWIIESWTPRQGSMEKTIALEEEWARMGVECLLSLRV